MPFQINQQFPSSINLTDTNASPVLIGQGEKVWLSLFREANCPFCNYRVYDLTHNYKKLSSMNLDIIAVFFSDQVLVEKFIAKQRRPFRMVADPSGSLHQQVESNNSRWGKIKAMFFRMPTMLFGMTLTGLFGLSTGHRMPADILIDETGKIIDIYRGEDAGDHIPMQQVIAFAIH